MTGAVHARVLGHGTPLELIKLRGMTAANGSCIIFIRILVFVYIFAFSYIFVVVCIEILTVLALRRTSPVVHIGVCNAVGAYDLDFMLPRLFSIIL